MDVLMLSHSDTEGGAAIAARRLQQGLRARGVDARMLVRRRIRPDEAGLTITPRMSRVVGKARFVLDKVPLLGYPHHNETPFSAQWLPDALLHRIARLQPDVIHVHWIGHGYMHPATLGRLKPPIVWTLHDVWPFTGGCHVNLGCTRYQEKCGACPCLGSSRDRDLSRTGWQRKQFAWSKRDLTLVAPSTWMADCARNSALFRDKRIEVIPNGLDTHCFRPADQRQVRARLGLPLDTKLVLFAVASGRRVLHKGFDLLEAALAHLGTIRASQGLLELVLAGSSAPMGSIRSGFRTRFFGPVPDEETMAALYAAVDVTVVPSRQESLSQVAVESLACGTPVVAFDTTGVPDVVDHQQNGYLAKPFDPEALAYGVQWVLEEADRHRRLCEAARSKALRTFDLNLQARQYHTLFQGLLAGQKTYPV